MINHNPNTNAESNPNPTCESLYEVWCKSREEQASQINSTFIFLLT